MVSSDFIIEATELNFQSEVIEYSQYTPVIVDFWAEWCQPCRTISPILERLTRQANGDFRLAKVDVDANPNIALQFNIRGIPAVKAFRQGQVISEFVGILPEDRIRTFLREIAPSTTDLKVMKAHSLLANHKWAQALATYEEVIAELVTPAPDVLLGFIKALLANNKPTQAQLLIKNFPASRAFTTAQSLEVLAIMLLSEETSTSDDPAELTYQRAASLIRRSNFEAALDGLLDVLRQNKNHRGGTTRKLVVALFEILGNDSEVVRGYRTELASILF